MGRLAQRSDHAARLWTGGGSAAPALVPALPEGTFNFGIAFAPVPARRLAAPGLGERAYGASECPLAGGGGRLPKPVAALRLRREVNDFRAVI